MTPTETRLTENVTIGSSHASAIDAHVGKRIRLRRTLLGLSQEKLGEALGVTFQQIQKYERGANRVGASRLYDIATVLDVPISFFFDDMLPPQAQPDSAGALQIPPPSPAFGGFSDTRKPFAPATAAPRPPVTNEDQTLLGKKETLELVRAYYRIRQPALRQKVLELVQSMSADEPDTTGQS
ncbi:helix-turn-helix domain-containing protein [Acetobacter garciniae]|uniref:helix-turn-helix domain-containing protein n=1 Tax=Acetobacter garciniae TaxID=2817435 RepID=UPI002ED94A66